MFKIGMIHGRFQPFHNGHFDYLKRALLLVQECLIVGITNPSPELTRSETTDDHRHLSSANPFTYFERFQMIHQTVFHFEDFPIEKNAMVSIIPFPIHDEHLWSYFVPNDAVQILSVFENWDIEKKKRFQQYGFKTFDLDCRRIISGTAIREILNNGGSWQSLVPFGTRQVLEKRLNDT